MMRCAPILALGGFLAAGFAAAETPPPTPQQVQFFETKVRPILADNCFKCHSAKKEMGGLRVDSAEALRKGGDSGPAVVPGKPEQSLLIQAVRRSGKLKMPPKTSLPEKAVADLNAWVTMGAPWPASKSASTEAAWKNHWAFHPVRQPALPAVKDTDWPRTSIDRFILAKLEEKGLAPSPAAERATLIRRASFNLIGLPPTPEEVQVFVNDSRLDAFAVVVDRLLASPHYGERWGRHWLDVARYADTKGYVFFQESRFPWAWTYRDYVIRAFNDDLPYDRFIVEQLAADQLTTPGGDSARLRAMGFLTLGDRFMNNPHDIIDDQIDAVSRGLLGLTVTCARCHDHKFDPIPTRDYYSLYGVFASSVEPTVPPLFAEPSRTEAYIKFENELKVREQKLEDFRQAKFVAVTTTAKLRAPEYMLKAHAMRGQPDAGEFMLLADGNDLNPAMLQRWRAYLKRMAQQHHPVFAPWHAYAALPEKEFAERAKALALQLESHHDPAKPLNPLVVQMIVEKPPQSMADLAKRYGELLNRIDRKWRESLWRASVTREPRPSRLPNPAEEELRQVFHGPETPPNVTRALFNDLDLLPDRPAQAELQKLGKAVEDWRANGPGAPPRAMVLVDARTPYTPHVFQRGNPGRPGEAVPRQFPAVLAGEQRKPFQHGSGRLELAQAIVDRNNPLTARVMVNRVWLHHFGAGLVRTPSDFGLRSDPPTHPELLDHLAMYFMDNGWSLKKLHRAIMLSATYQQASRRDERGSKLDPENMLLWRMNRQRLDFEALRDALLAVSGRLDPSIGGPSAGDLLASNRRTLYGHIDRLNLPGLFRTFDFPNPAATSAQRDQTTVPQQALFLMNSPFVQESSRRLVGRTEIAGTQELEQRIERLYRLLYGRSASAVEMSLARDYLGNAPKSADWDRYAQALLLANEFAFVD